MKSLEWMPLFGDDFWESERVAGMDDSAALLYSWLLWRQFKHGDLPPADSLRRLPHRWPGKEFDRLWPQVKACFDVLDDGRLSNPRCAEERSKMLSRVEAARIKGSSGGRARAAARSSTGIAPATAQAEPRHNHSSSTGQAQTGPDRDQDRTGVSPPTPLRGKPAAPACGGKTAKKPKPEFADVEAELARCTTAWSPGFIRRWLTYREQRGLRAFTPIGLEQFRKRCELWGEARCEAAMTNSTANGWEGLIEPKTNGHVNGNGVNGHRPAPAKTPKDLRYGSLEWCRMTGADPADHGHKLTGVSP